MTNLDLVEESYSIVVTYNGEIPHLSPDRMDIVKDALKSRGYYITFKNGIFNTPTMAISISYTGTNLDRDSIKTDIETLMTAILTKFEELDVVISG